jgi:hypothetical protein
MPKPAQISETVFFLDTNVLLQCKMLEELPWKEITSDPYVRLMLPATVCDELDRLKNDGKDRRAKRARLACKKCAEILESAEGKIIIRQSKPIVSLEFAPQADFDSKAFVGLDLSNADQKIVAETLAYSFEEPTQNVRLLTDDIGPKIVAKRLELPFTSVPENWLRLPEKDPRDRELEALRQEITRLSSAYASMDIRLEVGSGEAKGPLQFQFSRYPALEMPQIDELIDFANERLTSALDFEAYQSPHRVPISRHPMRYQVEQRRQQWINELKAFLERIHTAKNEQIESEILTLVISCDGVRPAEKIRVLIEVSGTISLTVAGEPVFEDREIRIPDPPAISQQPGPRIPVRGSPYRPPVGLLARLPDNFYRDTVTPSRCERLEFSCTEFTHQSDPAKLQFQISPTPNSEDGPNGSVKCTIRAKNLPGPLSQQLGISLKIVEENTFSYAKKLIEGRIPVQSA